MAADASGAEENSIQYRKLRSPSGHGSTLQIPLLSEVDSVWQSNREHTSHWTQKILDWRIDGQAEITKLALEYSQAYLGDDASAVSNPTGIVMAGHQPKLFHPGVWYKNFVLSNLGRRFNAVAINLVVDNDVVGPASIRYPKWVQSKLDTNERKATFGTVAVASEGSNSPHEAFFVDPGFLKQFPQRLRDAFGQQDCLAEDLWTNVESVGPKFENRERWNLGATLAAARHRLEWVNGLATLEVPIGVVAKTETFASFIQTIVEDAVGFQDCYNQAVEEYRQVHRIRSVSHPVPNLKQTDGWSELPFWVWQKADHPMRRALYVKRSNGCVQFSDLEGWEAELPSDGFVHSFLNLQDSVSIRPRALMTTMYARMVLSDLFLHGIGGSKYDQLTDVIASRFLDVQLPHYLTLSATMILPTNDYPLANKEDLTRAEQHVRELEYHPETFIANPDDEAGLLVAEKDDWTKGSHGGERSKEKHDAITRLNRKLGEVVESAHAAAKDRVRQVQSRLRTSEVIGSREYSFCLFPATLINELKRLAEVD